MSPKLQTNSVEGAVTQTDELFVPWIKGNVAQSSCRGTNNAIRVETEQLSNDEKTFL